MKLKNRTITISKLKALLYIITAWLPVSRIQFHRYNIRLLEIIAAQREMQMMDRQDIMTLANKMIKFHGSELKQEATKPVNNVVPMKKNIDNTENMFG